MERQDLRAKVFVSCGQRKNTEEAALSIKIKELLEGKGFEPYIAIEQQSLSGLSENIFRELNTSDYYLFVDFKREQLANMASCRGSLYTNQELAIAAFLKKPVIAFQETGVESNDGMLGSLQVNPIPFSDRIILCEMIDKEVEERGWDNRSKNKLEISYLRFVDTNLIINGQFIPARFFHLNVENKNLEKNALDCYAYAIRIFDKRKNQEVPVKAVELKWAGYVFPNATILKKLPRPLDAFFIFKGKPNELRFTSYSDSTEFMASIVGPGDFEITYEVASANFPEAIASFVIHLDNDIEKITIQPTF